MSVQVVCDYCHEDAELVDKSEVYRQGFGGKVWLCRPCRAWVPAHPDSPVHKPVGRLAKATLRAKRLKAYVLFDQLWRATARLSGWEEHKARHAAYLWLAEEMGITPANCHIGRFDEAATQVVIDICSAVAMRKGVAA